MLTIKEAKQKKSQLENIILSAIVEFEETTGISVSNISLERYKVTGKSLWITKSVEIESNL